MLVDSSYHWPCPCYKKSNRQERRTGMEVDNIRLRPSLFVHVCRKSANDFFNFSSVLLVPLAFSLRRNVFKQRRNARRITQSGHWKTELFEKGHNLLVFKMVVIWGTSFLTRNNEKGPLIVLSNRMIKNVGIQRWMITTYQKLVATVTSSKLTSIAIYTIVFRRKVRSL